MISSLSAAVIGVINFLEDALDVPGLSSAWVIGILILSAGLLAAGFTAFWMDHLLLSVGILVLLAQLGANGSGILRPLTMRPTD